MIWFAGLLLLFGACSVGFTCLLVSATASKVIEQDRRDRDEEI